MRNINVRFEEFVIMEESLKKFFFFFHFEPAMVHFLRDIYIYTYRCIYRARRTAAIPTNLLFMLFRWPGPRPVVIRATNQKLCRSRTTAADGATSGGDP